MIIKQKSDSRTYLEDTSHLEVPLTSIYLPQDIPELIGLLAQLRAENTPFTVSSGRTGTTGGCLPLSGIGIGMDNLNEISSINHKTETIEVAAGVSLLSLDEHLGVHGYRFAPAATEELATLSGAIATSASGVRGFGYGSIRNYIVAITVCLATGEMIRIERGSTFARGRRFQFSLGGRGFDFKLPSYTSPDIKSQAGYYVHEGMDLIDLFIGSEGTLGIVTSCAIKIQKVPLSIFDGLIFFKSENDAFSFVNDIQTRTKAKQLGCVSLEFFDSSALSFLKPGYSFIPDSEACIYFEVEFQSDAGQDKTLESIEELLEKHNAQLEASILADERHERKKIFEFRHALPQKINEFLRHNNQAKVAGDIATCREAFPRMYTIYKQCAAESGITCVNFGHIGESHLHFNFLPKNSSEHEKAKEYLKRCCEAAIRLGGTVSAEHGIGKLKKRYLELMYTDLEIREMAALKKYFDPDCLLGLDTIFDKELLYD